MSLFTFCALAITCTLLSIAVGREQYNSMYYTPKALRERISFRFGLTINSVLWIILCVTNECIRRLVGG